MKNSAIAGFAVLGLFAVACGGTSFDHDETQADALSTPRYKDGDDDDDCAETETRDDRNHVFASRECAPVFAKCEGGEPNVVRSTEPQIGGVEVHEISVSEARPDLGPKTRHVKISVNRAGRHVLVLRAYNSVDFELIVDAKSTLAAVLIDGYFPQSISGVPAGVLVENRSGDATMHNLCSYDWPKANGHCDAPVLPGEGGLPRFAGLSDLTGCYGPLSFSINDDDCGPTPKPQPEPTSLPDGGAPPSGGPVVR
jgi:hypothetical protein